MKIESVTTKSGQEIKLGKITLLVGPNNSGKSQTLRDIKEKMETGKVSKPVIFDRFSFVWPQTFEELIADCKIKDSPHTFGNKLIFGLGANLLKKNGFEYMSTYVAQKFLRGNEREELLGQFTQFKVAYLDSSTRLLLGSETKAYNPHKEQAENVLQTFLHSKPSERILIQVFKQAFGMDIVFDASGFSEWCFRVAEQMPAIPQDTRDAGVITSGIAKLDVQGDGFRSLVGVIIGLLQTNGRVILLDEPEAFLHPSQAKYLGKWIADNAHNFTGQLIISTHNSNFLAGILSGSNPVDVYRLNRQGNNTHFNLLPASATIQLAKHPLLSSQRVLEAIFHKGVVVCEADADRAIYQSVASINLENQDILFIHAHNKQTLKDVVALLTAAKVPTAAIADIDILNTEDDFVKIIETLTNSKIEASLVTDQQTIAKTINNVTEEEILTKLQATIVEFSDQLKKGEHTLSGAKGAISRISKSITKWSDAKEKGIAGFDLSIRDLVSEVIEKVKSYGLFIAPVGELESWINLGVTKKNKWIVPALNVIHEGKTPENLKQFVQQVIYKLNQW